MLPSLLVSAVLACTAPLCVPVELGNGELYFPCHGREFGAAWQAYFATHEDRVMNGGFTFVYDVEGRLVGYRFHTIAYIHPTPDTITGRIAEVLFDPL